MKKLFLSLLLLVATLQVGAQQPVKFDHEVIIDGSETTIAFYAEIEDGYYMYSTDIPKGGPMPITIRITESEGVELDGNLTPVDAPKTKYEPAFNMDVNYFTEFAEFEQKIKPLGGDYKIKGYLRYQACGLGGCVPDRYEFEISEQGAAVVPAVSAPVVEEVVAEPAPVVVPEMTAPVVEDAVAEPTPVVVPEATAPVVEDAVAEPAPVVVPETTAPVVEDVVAESAPVVVPEATAPVVEDAVAEPAQVVVPEETAPVVEDAVAELAPVVVPEATAPVVEDAVAEPAPTDVPEETAPAQDAQSVNAEPAEKDTWAPVEWGKKKSNTIWTIFILGFGGGLLALLTPCVWPIIPMTVSFFLKRSKEKKQAVREAVLYGVSIIVIYLVLGLVVTSIFGAAALNELATNAWFNIFFFLLLVVFGASFLGGFELKLPSSWTNSVDTKASSTTGVLSIFLMAFTLALVSFSCTGPIVGLLLVETATSGDILAPAVGMFGFALALALPFTIFAMFPSLLKKAPRSGSWMNTIKVVLGFVEIALALKFLSVADLTKGWGILDRETFLALWIVLFTLLGLYLLKIIRFPHDDPEEKTTSVPSFFVAVVSLSFAVYMIPGLWGAPCKAVSAFAPPMWTQDFNLYDQKFEPDTHDYDEAIEISRAKKKPIFLDFTGHGCVNCREMEAAVLTDANVLSTLEENFVVASLYVDDRDELPEPFVGKDGKTYYEVGEKWAHLQKHKFGAVAQPFYVIVDSDGNLLGTRSFAFNKDVADFLDFLQEGFEDFNK